MKRRVSKIVLFLLLGAVVNVAVAWGCALAMIRPEPVYTNKIPGHSADGWEAVYFYPMYLPDVVVPGGPPHPYVRGVVCFGYDARSVRWWYSVYSGAAVQINVGWPVTCMTGGMWERRWLPGAEWVGGGVPVVIQRSYVESIAIDGEENLYVGGFPRLLPLTPQHTGFAINTIFYATVLWLLTFGPFTARRIVRRRRGHCIKCGYDLRGAEHEVCPECGS